MAVLADPTMARPVRFSSHTALAGRMTCLLHRMVPAPVAPSRRFRTAAEAWAVAPVARVAEMDVQTCRTPAPPAAWLTVAWVAAAGVGVPPADHMPGGLTISEPTPDLFARLAADPDRAR